jgi:hypothetical protein
LVHATTLGDAVSLHRFAPDSPRSPAPMDTNAYLLNSNEHR